jgi:hypothetical protein
MIWYRPSIAPDEWAAFAAIPQLKLANLYGIENFTEAPSIGETRVIPIRVTAGGFLIWCKRMDLSPNSDALDAYAQEVGRLATL